MDASCRYRWIETGILHSKAFEGNTLDYVVRAARAGYQNASSAGKASTATRVMPVWNQAIEVNDALVNACTLNG